MEETESEIHLVTTSHVSQESVKDVREAIEEIQPDIVGVELDIKRYRALKEKGKTKKRVGFFGGNIFLGFVMKLLSYLQKRVGRNIGVDPGSEMLEAIEVAEEHGLEIALLDRDINVTLKRMWKKMSFLEKIKTFGALVLGLFGFGRKEIDLDEITEEENVNFLLEELRKFSPGAAEAIIDERDAYIAGKILAHISEGKKIVAVIGAGHKDGVINYLKNYEKIPDLKKLSEV